MADAAEEEEDDQNEEYYIEKYHKGLIMKVEDDAF